MKIKDDNGVQIKIINKCDTCVYEFATCRSNPRFAVDEYPELKLAHKKEADAVVSCDGYVNVMVGELPWI